MLRNQLSRRNRERYQQVDEIEIGHSQEGASHAVGQTAHLQHAGQAFGPPQFGVLLRVPDDPARTEPGESEQRQEQEQPEEAMFAQHLEVDAVHVAHAGHGQRFKAPTHEIRHGDLRCESPGLDAPHGRGVFFVVVDRAHAIPPGLGHEA